MTEVNGQEETDIATEVEVEVTSIVEETTSSDNSINNSDGGEDETATTSTPVKTTTAADTTTTSSDTDDAPLSSRFSGIFDDLKSSMGDDTKRSTFIKRGVAGAFGAAVGFAFVRRVME